MTDKLKEYVLSELRLGAGLLKEKNYDKAFRHFERAHILGQKSPKYHVLSHLWMLKTAFLKRDLKELVGQIIRIPLGFIGSLVGLVPTGDSGGSNVNLFKPMPIPDDLKKIINDSSFK